MTAPKAFFLSFLLMDPLKQVVVLGAGVVGLTAALSLQEKGAYAVTIVAEVFPSDAKTIKYTSLWAGAHHTSEAARDDLRQQKIDQETYHKMWDMSAPGGPAEGCFMRIPHVQYYNETFEEPHPLAWMHDFKVLPRSSLIGQAVAGVSFSTVTIDTPVYLNYLLSRFLAAGGTIIRGTVQHINQIVEGGARMLIGSKNPSPPDAVIVCAGLGARFLGGIEDKTMYPFRGQTIVVRAPWVNFGRGLTIKDRSSTYIIPRRSGDVIIGGTKIANDWYPVPRSEITEDILKRAFALCPELVPPEIRAERDPTIEDIRAIIIEEGCGLRPARKDGIRLDVEWIEGIGKGRVPIVFNYGHDTLSSTVEWDTSHPGVRPR
ncbi:FAD dependent oxidoreductase [Mycena floridula]|nr:FAD dependent oxidoreductase [Mycena floridula]